MNRTDYETWLVHSATDGDNHVLKMWIREGADDYEPAKLICLKTVISESVSDTNPYGIFISP